MDGFDRLQEENEPHLDGVSYRMLMCGLPVDDVSDSDIMVSRYISNLVRNFKNGSSQETARRSSLLSTPNLPLIEHPPQELFKDSVGPIKSAHILFSHAGKSVGIALLTFQRGIDCKRAIAAFDGRTIEAQP